MTAPKPSQLPPGHSRLRLDLRRTALDHLRRQGVPVSRDELHTIYGFPVPAIREHGESSIAWASRQHDIDQGHLIIGPPAAITATAGAGAAGVQIVRHDLPLLCPHTGFACTQGRARCGDFGCYLEG